MADDPSFQDLRGDAKAWEISAGGSTEELAARLAEHREVVALELGDHTDQELADLAVAHRVESAGLDRKGVITALVAAHVAWHDGEPSEAEQPSGQRSGADVVTPPGTVWMDRGGVLFHVDFESAAYDALVVGGAARCEAPADAEPHPALT